MSEEQVMNVVEVKMVQWFDEHFYKVDYTIEEQCATCGGTGRAANSKQPPAKWLVCPSCDGVGKIHKPITDYFPSVTTKLGIESKPGLISWYGDLGTREATRRKQEAADRGSRIHAAWQCYTMGGAVIWQDYKLPQYTPEQISEIEKKFPCTYVLRNQNEMYEMMKLKKFLEILKPIKTWAEMTVYDIVGMDAGTVDNLFLVAEGEYPFGNKPVKLEGGLYVFDLKTGTTMGDGDLQVSAYVKIIEKMGGFSTEETPLKGGLIGHTGSKTKTGIEGFSLKVIGMEEVEENYKDYLAISEHWMRRNKNMKPKIFELPTLITIEQGAKS